MAGTVPTDLKFTGTCDAAEHLTAVGYAAGGPHNAAVLPAMAVAPDCDAPSKPATKFPLSNQRTEPHPTAGFAQPDEASQLLIAGASSATTNAVAPSSGGRDAAASANASRLCRSWLDHSTVRYTTARGAIAIAFGSSVIAGSRDCITNQRSMDGTGPPGFRLQERASRCRSVARLSYPATARPYALSAARSNRSAIFRNASPHPLLKETS